MANTTNTSFEVAIIPLNFEHTNISDVKVELCIRNRNEDIKRKERGTYVEEA